MVQFNGLADVMNMWTVVPHFEKCASMASFVVVYFRLPGCESITSTRSKRAS